MKILAVIGSPRKGNTYRLVQQIEECIKKYEDVVEFEYLFLKDMQLEMCKGCFACISKGEQFCPNKDDLSKVIEKISDSDGVIFASPVYIFNVSGLMKNFMDRLSYVCHRPCFFGKYAMVVTTSCGGGINETLKCLETTTRSWGFNFVNKLGVMQHPAVGISPKTKGKIQNTSKEFCRVIKSGKTNSPRLKDLLQFRIMKFNSIESKNYFAADFDFYKNMKDYYIDMKINIFKNKLAHILERLIIKMIGNNA